MKNLDGLIETGRAMNIQGAHVRGHNKGTIAICLIGKSRGFTQKQLLSVVDVIKMISETYNITDIVQHSDLDPKKPHCAGLGKDFLNQLKKGI